MTNAPLSNPTSVSRPCSVLAAERDEPMLGSAFAQGGVLLVEQPGAWGRGGLSDSGFDPEVAQILDARATVAGLRLLAIRRPGRTTPGRRSWAVKLPGEPALRWSSYDRDAELLEASFDAPPDTASEGPTYLVCAHAKRDQCCAVLGRPAAAALEAMRPGRVWECSHTGGHRFAPIVLALPAAAPGGALYGRVGADELSRLVEATERGQTLPHRLRGLIGHSAAAQAAIATAMAETGRTAFGAWGARPDGDDRWILTSEGLTAEVRITETVDDEPFPSCLKPGPEPQRHFRPSGFRLL